jgi:hypothetical protein
MARAALITSVLLGFTLPLTAQNRSRPFEIADNSFLVEEAFNQEGGIFQNIFLFQRARSGGNWGVEFTQEWPLGGQRHQFSYTVPFDFSEGELGDILLNYRLQLRMEDETGPALSPRLSAILPTGPDDAFDWGVQVNLPGSKQFGDLYLHANVGATMRQLSATAALTGERSLRLYSQHVAGSVIWRALPLVHLMVESVAAWEENVAGVCCATERDASWLVSPGIRVARNLGTHQLVVGAAAPFAPTGAKPESAIVLYLSYELPFRKTN